jgi:peptidoglycan hydrolase CwlO-like protein
MFKRIITSLRQPEVISLTKYIEVHTKMVENQLKFYNFIITIGGGFIIWSIDNEKKHVDKRFEQVDKRFEQVDKRFEQVDKRFEQVDKRFENLEHELKEIKELITNQNKT